MVIARPGAQNFLYQSDRERFLYTIWGPTKTVSVSKSDHEKELAIMFLFYDSSSGDGTFYKMDADGTGALSLTTFRDNL